MEKETEQNVYAKNIKGEFVHISDVESGRKGYYCIGCNREMQAKKGKIKKEHFAHDPKDVALQNKCSYSDETHRHYLAKRILEEIKQIKVPILYKYPPNGTEGKPYKIKDATVIKAFTVKSEIIFYENQSGVICWGKKDDTSEDKENFLLIKPDIAFFDEQNNPILLIEIVATHKIDIEKLSKIRRLGINTVQITVPKDTPEGIRNIFYITNRTQWIYNYEQEETTYIRVPEGNTEGILPIDSFQRKLLESIESYECRKAQISNLIRGIRKCLETEQYAGIVHTIRGELQRVEENTERDRNRLRNIQDRHRSELNGKYSGKREQLAAENRQITDEEKDLERRYFDKNRKLGNEEEDLERRYYAKYSELEQEQERIDRETAEWERNVNNPEPQLRRIDREERELSELTQKAEGEHGYNTRRIQQSRTELPTKYGNLENELREEFDGRGEELRSRFEELRRCADDAIQNRDFERSTRMFTRIKGILDAKRHIINIAQISLNYQRLRGAKKVLDEKTYQDWV